MNNFIKKIFYGLLTQGIIVLLSLITGFVMPKVMGTLHYGYWAIYIFYVGYLNLFGFGYSDGFNLVHAGSELKDLEKAEHRTAFVLLTTFFLVLGVLFASFLFLSGLIDPEKKIVYIMVALNIPNMCIYSILLSVLLAANKTIMYNNINLVLKLLSTLLIIALFFVGNSNFIYIILADAVARTVIMVVCVIFSRHYIIGRLAPIKAGLLDIREKCSAGIKVTASIILASAMPLAGKIVLEYNQDIKIYGQYSFTMTLLTLIITFTSTVGVLIFPMMRTVSTDMLKTKYQQLSIIIDHIISFALLVYIPIFYLLSNYMKEYSPVLNYSGLIIVLSFPIARNQLLITPFFKTLRFEKALLFWNIIGFGFVFGACKVAFSIFNSQLSLAATTLVAVIIWTQGIEKYLITKCRIEINLKHELITIGLISIFVASTMTQSLIAFTLVYLPAVLIYTYLEKEYFNTFFKILYTKKSSKLV